MPRSGGGPNDSISTNHFVVIWQQWIGAIDFCLYKGMDFQGDFDLPVLITG